MASGLPGKLCWQRTRPQYSKPQCDSWVGKISREKRQAAHSRLPGLPWWFREWRICLQCGRGARLLDWEDPWRRAWRPTPSFLPGASPWTEQPGRAAVEEVRRSWWGHSWAAAHRPARGGLEKRSTTALALPFKIIYLVTLTFMLFRRYTANLCGDGR